MIQHKQDLQNLRTNWNQFGEDDPLWAVLVEKDKARNKWDLADFLKRASVK